MDMGGCWVTESQRPCKAYSLGLMTSFEHVDAPALFGHPLVFMLTPNIECELFSHPQCLPINMKNWRIYKVRDYLNVIHLLDQSKVVVFFKCDRFWDQYTCHVHVYMANLDFTPSLKLSQQIWFCQWWRKQQHLKAKTDSSNLIKPFKWVQIYYYWRDWIFEPNFKPVHVKVLWSELWRWMVRFWRRGVFCSWSGFFSPTERSFIIWAGSSIFIIRFSMLKNFLTFDSSYF
jgi:hypothetical protein